MSDEEKPSSSPSDGSIPPVEPIVADDLPDTGSGAPDAPDATDATDAVAPVEEPTPIPLAEPVPAGPNTSATRGSSHVLLPKWLVFGVVGVALACLGFGVGWIAKSGSDSNDSPASAQRFPNGNPFGENGPFSGDNGNGNGNNGNGDADSGIRVDGAFLGVSARPTTDDTEGAVVGEVVDGSPADDAGLATGDVITEVDDETIDDPAELVAEISDHDPGDDVTITYTRDGDTKTADATLADRADQEIPSPSLQPGTED